MTKAKLRKTSTSGDLADSAGHVGVSAVAPGARWQSRLGSKANEATYKTIINQIPPHRVYIEPFLGWGAVLLNKTPAAYSVGLDLDRDRVAEFDRTIVAAHSPLLTISESSSDVFERATSLSAASPATAARVAAALPSRARGLCSLVVADAFAFLSAFPWRGDEFLYLDPPYMPETRTSKHRYRYELTAFDHARLLALVLNLPARVMVSGYRSALYERLLSSWRVVMFEAITRGGTLRTEYLWCNFPEPVELHDYRWLGKDHRERQDLNRMRKRWIAKLEDMPPIKRHALFAALRDYTIAASGESADDYRRMAAGSPLGSGKEHR